MGESGRKLRNVRAAEAVRAFKKLGYEVVRVRGSHYVLKHRERGMLIIPFHRGAVKSGILLDALDRAQISVESFEELL